MLAEEELRKLAEKENKITMRKALDDQVTEKQYRLNLEKHIDSEQGRLWKTDADNFKYMTFQNEGKVSYIFEVI